jgi:hypothetical protein
VAELEATGVEREEEEEGVEERERAERVEGWGGVEGTLRACPAMCRLYSAVSMRRMYGMMLSICTLPIRPAKKSSSMVAA